MYETVRNKRVLVTGSSSGIGASVAKLFASHGAQVGLHYAHSKEAALEVSAEIEDGGGRVQVFQGDFLEASARTRLIPSFVERFGGIDVLVSNAGTSYGYEHFSQLGEEVWDKTFALNVKAPFVLSRDAFAHMKEQGWGRIINISSVAVKYTGSNTLPYTASKAASETVMRGLSREGARHNVLVNSIRCGVIDTPMRTRVSGYSEEAFQERVSLVPVGHAGTPDDVARMALFLASEGGDYITGECFAVAGGD